MEKHIEATTEAGKNFYLDFHTKDKVVMLNLLKFKPIADYSNLESIAPKRQITGEEAYQLYMKHTKHEFNKVGSRVLFHGKSHSFLIGPNAEKWDVVLLVEHASISKFMEFAKSEDYLKYSGHRTASLEDSRLLPIDSNKNSALL